MLISSVSSASLIYKASISGAAVVPPVSSKASGSVSISLLNSSYASGYFYATNINQMTMAHLHVGSLGSNGPPVVWTFNATYGPISGSVKASFSFDPSVKNVSALLAAGLVYFNIHTAAHPSGEIRGQLIPPSKCSTTGPAVCEIVGGTGVHFTLTCPSGLKISSVTSAFYGRSDSNTCPYPGNPTAMQNTACSSPSVLPLLLQAAVGVQSYEVTFLSDLLMSSDPCPGTFKYFNATWCCAGNVTPRPALLPSPPSDSDSYGSTSTHSSVKGDDSPPPSPEGSIIHSSEYKVIVIGGGLSGLTAARMLTDANLNTLVLEGQSVPGGRIKTRTLTTQTYVAEEGANWIHGYSSENPLYTLAKNLNLSIVVDPQGDNTYTWENGKLLQDDGQEYKPLKKVLTDFLAWMKGALSTTDTRSIQDMVNLYISSMGLDARSTQLLTKGFNGKIIQEESVPASLLSARLYDFSEKFPGGEGLFAGKLGTSAFVSGTISPLNKVPLNIAFDKKVTAISYGGSDGLVKVTTSDGSMYSARYVICSVSLGVLKSNAISFTPPLPAPKRQAMADMIMGNLERIVLVFPSNFWDSKNDLKAAWLNRLTLDPSSSYWNEWFTPYSALQRNVLIGWNAGSTAISSMNLTDAQLLKSALDALSSMFPRVKIPQPLEWFTSRWTTNPFILGAYSNIAATALKPPQEAMAEPLGSSSSGLLLWAGEHTSDTFYGTMQGALISGQREASRILDQL